MTSILEKIAVLDGVPRLATIPAINAQKGGTNHLTVGSSRTSDKMTGIFFLRFSCRKTNLTERFWLIIIIIILLC